MILLPFVCAPPLLYPSFATWFTHCLALSTLEGQGNFAAWQEHGCWLDRWGNKSPDLYVGEANIQEQLDSVKHNKDIYQKLSSVLAEQGYVKS